MKYWLILLVACLALVEFFHHRMHQHAHDTGAPPSKEEARELFRQHMHQHR